jgi:ATP-dependent Lon protease
MVISGSMLPLNTDMYELFVNVRNAGAKRIFLPEDSRDKYEELSSELKKSMETVFYSTPIEAARIALGVDY